MAASADVVEYGCIFHWKIERMFNWWKLKNKDGISSPVFIAEKLQKTKWILRFYPIRDRNDNDISICLQREKDCKGPDAIEVCFQFTFLGEDRTALIEGPIQNAKFLKEENKGIILRARNRIFITDREHFLPNDTLNVKCTLWITADVVPDNFDEVFATTVVKVKCSYFQWKIYDLQPDMKSKFGDYLISCCIHLQTSVDRLCVSLSDLNDSIIYISCNISIMHSGEIKERCVIQKFFYCDWRDAPLNDRVIFTLSSQTWMETKVQSFKDSVLTLDFAFNFLTVEHLDCSKHYANLENGVVENASQNMTVRNVDHYQQYSSVYMNDIELRTYTKTFKAHRNFLRLSSPVFERMMSCNVKENCGRITEVYVTDFEDDIVFKMLQYIYSNNLKGSEFQQRKQAV